MERITTTIPQAEVDRQLQYCREIARMNADRGETPLAFVDTYGCQQNEADSERIRGYLRQMGYDFTTDEEQARIIVLNTCAIREHAEQRVLGNLGALVHVKRRHPEQIICLCGCMAQEAHVAEKVRQSFRHVDLVFGPHVLWKFPEFIHTLLTQRGRIFSNADDPGSIAEGIPVVRQDKVKAWVSIMYGCNNFCSYCIVPYVRGRERSRDPQAVLAEVRQLVEAGYKDITLLGQNVNSYGKDLDEPMDFADLLRAASEIPGDFLLRFMTSHPKDMTFAMIDAIADSKKVVNHMHLPIQCGSDELLKKMNRGYTVEHYLELVDYARKRMPDLVLTTDIIVGFPGETEAMFEDTLNLLKRVQYDMAYTFIYSPRTGTPAAKMEDQIPQEEKSRRLQRLMDVQNVYSLAKNKEMEDHVYDVIVEGPTKNDANYWFGRTTGNKMIIWENDGSVAIGDTVPVQVDKGQTWVLKGHLVH